MADYTERFSVELGAMLRRARKSLGMSLADVEKACDGQVKAVTLRNYEMAERGMLVETFDAIVRLYRLNPGWLMDEAERAAMLPPAAAA